MWTIRIQYNPTAKEICLIETNDFEVVKHAMAMALEEKAIIDIDKH